MIVPGGPNPFFESVTLGAQSSPTPVRFTPP